MMKIAKKFSLKELLKRPLIFCVIAALFTVLAGQMHIITDQYGLIEELLAENAELKESLADTEGRIDNILATQADIKNYQQELDRWFKGPSFGVLKKIGKLLSFRDDKELPPGMPVLEGGNSRGHRLAGLEFAAEKAKYDVTSLFKETESIKTFMLGIPSLKPAKGPISSVFGKRVDPFSKAIKQHNGIDIAGKYGDPVKATARGRVVSAKFHHSFGYMVEIDHGHRITTLSAHLSAITVKPGQWVEKGQNIGKVGNTGTRCHGTHVHFEIKKNGVQMDPIYFIADSVLPSSKAL